MTLKLMIYKFYIGKNVLNKHYNRKGEPSSKDNSHGDVQVRNSNGKVRLFAKYHNKWYSTPLSIAPSKEHRGDARFSSDVIAGKDLISKGDLTVGDDITMNGDVFQMGSGNNFIYGNTSVDYDITIKTYGQINLIPISQRKVDILTSDTSGSGETTRRHSFNGSSHVIFSGEDDSDYYRIVVAASGATTIETKDSAAAAAHLTLDVDGDIILDPNSGITKFYKAGDTDDLCTLTVAANGVTTIATADSDGEAGDLILNPDGDLIFEPEGRDLIYRADNGNTAAKWTYVPSSITSLILYEAGGLSDEDYLQILVGAHGVTNITTVSDSGTDAYLSIAPDGYMKTIGATTNTVQADGGDITLDASTGIYKFLLDSDTNDLCTLTVAANGATTLATADSDGAVGHLTLDVDGDLILDPASGITKFYYSGDTDDYAHLRVSANGVTTLTSVDSDGTAGDIVLNANGDINLDSDTGITNFKLAGDANDLCTLTVAANGVTTLATADDGGTVGHLTIAPDGDLILDPVSQNVIINATDKLYFDGGSDTYIREGSSDVMQFYTGGMLLMQMAEAGNDGNAVFFKAACVGFTQKTETFSDDSIIGSGGTDDTHIDFRHSNKITLAVTGAITNLNLIFPNMSGNFVLLLTYDGDHTITNYKVYESDESAADGDADVFWPGGTKPDNTASGADVLSFYWDASNEKCYGVGSLAFATP
jgi:hypothetical protein